MVLSREELAWAAGLYDGEGSTIFFETPRKTAGNYLHIRAAVAQDKDPGVLNRFRAAVGEIGKVYGPYKRPPARLQWRYDAGGFERTQAVIAMLWPWLSQPKRRQAVEALNRYRWAKVLDPQRTIGRKPAA